MRIGDYTIQTKYYDLIPLGCVKGTFEFTGKIKYVRYPNKVDIYFQYRYEEFRVIFKHKKMVGWVNTDDLMLKYKPLPLSIEIVDCSSL